MLRDLHWSLIGQFRHFAALAAAADVSTTDVSIGPSLDVLGQEPCADPMSAHSGPSQSKLRRQRAKRVRDRLWHAAHCEPSDSLEEPAGKTAGEEDPEESMSKSQVIAFIEQNNTDMRHKYEEIYEARLEALKLKYEDVIAKQRCEIEKIGAKLAAAVEKEAQSERPMTREKIQPGMCVRIKGLKKRCELNGGIAKIVSFDAGSGRYKCQLIGEASGDSTVGCKLENLDIQQSDAEELANMFSTPSLSRLSIDDDDARASGVHGPLGQSLLARAMGAGRMGK